MIKPSIELPISSKPTDLELKKLKEYFKEMPVNEIITGLIGRFDLQQSMANGTITGSIDVLDGVGLLTTLPIRAEENLKLRLKSHDLQTELNLDLQIIEISNVSIQKESGDQYAYTLHFITKSSWNALTENVITAFRQKPASY